MSGGIFISYRRDDAAHVTGRIADALAQRFGRERIFVDVDSVAPGEDFVRKIQSSIADSTTFLAVIGSNWLDARTARGERRIDLPGDFIRLEVESALAAGVRIIPVLVDGASMPRAEDLPPEVAQLVRHNAVQLNHTTFSRDMDALIRELEPPRLTQRLAAPRTIASVAAVVAVIALGAALWTRSETGAPSRQGAATSLSLKTEGEGAEQQERWLLQVGFRAERDADGRLSILTDLPYRDRLRAGRIDGTGFMSSPIANAWPTLLVQIANPSDAPLVINELQFEVLDAAPDLEPVPVVRENRIDYHAVQVVNEGWGDMQQPRLTLTGWGLPEEDMALIPKVWRGDVRSDEPCAAPKRRVDLPPVVVDGVSDGDGGATFDLSGRMPPGFEDAIFICAIGELSYAHAGETVTLALRTRVSNRRPDAIVAAPGWFEFDLYLDPDREGYTAVVPAFAEIAAGDTANIAVKVHTDRASRFDLRYAVRTAAGTTIAGEGFDLDYFAPRHNAWSGVPSQVPATVEPVEPD